jgi:Protein of unknown function (DUF3047)
MTFRRLLFLFGLTIVYSLPAFPEPPPRGERAPTSARPNSGPAPFWATGWSPGYPVPSAWSPRYFHYETRYTAAVEGDELVFETFADGTASWIARSLLQDLTAKPDECLNWRWSADQLPILNAPEDSLRGDDFAARVYVFGQFENGDPFGFNYVWSSGKRQGETWKSPWSENKLMALRSGTNQAGDIVAESRSTTEDIWRAYGKTPIRINGIALMTDSEGSNSVAAARISLPQFGPCDTPVS